jgi:putative tricarboxylic transport membrane protein
MDDTWPTILKTMFATISQSGLFSNGSLLPTKRRNRSQIAALISALLVMSSPAEAQLVIVAPAAPGGGWDQTARVLQRVLSSVEPGLSVQVENVPGAAGRIGLARFVTAERGNPEALLVTGLVMLSAITTNSSPVTLDHVTPIARLTGEYEVIVVPASSPIRTLRELLDAFIAAPALVSWGGGSAGGTDDLLVRLIAEAVGVPPGDANYVAFSGGGAALAALLGGQVTAGVSGYGEFAGQIESGALRLLAVSSPARVAGIDAPTLREQGVDRDLANWRAVVAPPGLSDAERDALAARVERMALSPEWQAALERNGWENLLLTGPAFRQFLLAEQHRVDAVLRRLRSDAVQPGGRRASVSPSTLPAAAFGALACLLALALVRAARGHAALPASAWRVHARPLVLLGYLALHAVLLPLAGFIPANAALFAIAAGLLGSRRPLRDIAVGVAIAAVLFAVFTAGLGLSLPQDPVTRWSIR